MAGSWTDAASVLGVHHPGSTWLHRLPAGAKVVGLLVAVVVVLLVSSPWAAPLLALAGVLVLASTGAPWGQLFGLLRLLLVMLIALALVQTWLIGWEGALVGVSRVIALVTLAWAVSLTTPLTEMLDLLARVLRPLQRVGVDTERMAMTVALAIRSVPLVIGAVAQADEARRARGARLSVRALVVPSVVRAVKIAEALGDGLLARGYGQRSPESQGWPDDQNRLDG